MWIQKRTHGWTPKAHSLWAISLVWCTRDVVDAAGVDVEGGPEVAHAHGRALEMPAREAAAPGRVPLLLTRARPGRRTSRARSPAGCRLPGDVADALRRPPAPRDRAARTRRSAGTSRCRSRCRRRCGRCSPWPRAPVRARSARRCARSPCSRPRRRGSSAGAGLGATAPCSRPRSPRRGLPARAAAASILSSPASASSVRWPTSVMLMTWVTRQPSSSRARLRRSANRSARRLPTCCGA